MCIIVCKPKGEKLPNKQTLKNCFDNNSDGAGFMFTKNNQVYFEKGFFDFEKFYKRLLKEYDDNNLIDKNLVLHFRIGTSGGINKEKTHPFIISNKKEELNKTSGYCKSALVHNGIISDYVNNNLQLSDTQNFIKNFLYPLLKLSHFDFKNKFVNELITKELATNKIIMLDSKDNLYKFGDFIKEDGILYSNSTYCYSYKNYMKYYDDYYTTTKYYSSKKEELPFEEEENNYKQPDQVDEKLSYDELIKKCKKIKYDECVEFSDGFCLDPLDYEGYYKYYISKDGEVYEVSAIDTSDISYIGNGRIIKIAY